MEITNVPQQKPVHGFATGIAATVPTKAWFAIFRLYGPLDPWFDRT